MKKADVSSAFFLYSPMPLPIPRFVTVAVSGPLRRSFTYRTDPALSLEPGQRVLVPFGRRRTVGYYIGESEPPPSGVNCKEVTTVIDETPLLPAELVRLLLWMADYYFANPADCLAAALPSQMKSARKPRLIWATNSTSFVPANVARLIKKGKPVSDLAVKRIKAAGADYLKRLKEDRVIIDEIPVDSAAPHRRLLGYRITAPERWAELFARSEQPPAQFHGVRTAAELREAGISDHYRRKALRAEVIEEVVDTTEIGVQPLIDPRRGLEAITLNEPQAEVVTTVGKALGNGFQTFLLHGITGSGKTLVYCHLARKVVEQGGSVLVLTPEIALSSTTLAYFRGLFGDKVTVLHSGMTAAERLASWNGIRQQRFNIVVGPRSALFAPLERLGLIVVDEEHDDSYKQDDPSPRFHGRDAAIMRGRLNDIPVLLGSASPSVESYHNATTGRYKLLEIKSRPAGAKLPTVHLIDMRHERIGGDLPFVSLPLKTEVQTQLADGRQVILFLNRRGYAPYLKCRDCGHIPQCGNCQVRLTYHKAGDHLACHYCGTVRAEYAVCENCGGHDFLFFGAGTQKVEETVGRLWQEARPVRMDSDTATGRASSHALLTDFAARKYNLLLGTQMVTKGLDLDGVSLVGVLAADMGMGLPDFRASERTFSRLLQVAGRSGRSDHPGKVIIQTWDPEQDLIADAARQDYRSFYDREIELRSLGQYPPFCRLVNLILSGEDDKVVERESFRFRDRLQAVIADRKLQAQLLGPAPCAFHRLRSRFRRHMFVKVRPEQTARFVRLLTDWEQSENRFGLPAAVQVTVDVDPADML